MAIEAILRKLIAGPRPAAGARSSVDALSLADYDALFERRPIHTGFRSEEPEAPPYRQILGPAFDTLPPRLTELHGSKAARRWLGHAEVRRGPGLLARVAASMRGFPAAAEASPLHVRSRPAQ